MDFDHISALEHHTLIPTYDRLPILAVRGEGCYLYDDRGRKYLDFFAGLAVNALGYAHPEILAVLRDEAESLLHVSNLIYHRYQAPLAEKLARWAGLDRVFFGNTGTEVTEGAIKLARAYARKNHPAEPFERYEILAVQNSFHGRTAGALAATWPEKYRAPFEPLLPGVRFVRLNDVAHLRESFTPCVAALMVETIQGEGGVVKISEEFLKTAEALCRAHDALLIIDEIQTGFRTGTPLAFAREGIVPDILCLSKSIANGLPIGVTVVTEAVSERIPKGSHGGTFAGNPLVCAAGAATLWVLSDHTLHEHAATAGSHFQQRVRALDLPNVREVRGRGLMLAVELKKPATPVLKAMQERGVLTLPGGGTVIRFLPSILINDAQLDEGIAVLAESLGELS